MVEVLPIPAHQDLAEALTRTRAEELDDLHREHRADRTRSLLATWASGWLRRTRRAVAEAMPDVGPGEVGISWVGHASVVVRYSKLTIACDPMLGRRLGWAPRQSEPGLSAAEHGDVGLILIGGPDPERLHPPTLARLPRAATIVVPPRCAGLVSDLGFARVVELGIGQTLVHRGVDVATTSVHHEGRGGRGTCAYVLRGDGPSLFVCGGSGYFSGFTEVGQRYRPDIALLPISGYVPRGFRRENMSPLDALYAFEDLGARLLIPIRHSTFQRSYETLDEPTAWLAELARERQLESYVNLLPVGASRKYT